MSKTIEIIVSPQGQSTLQTKGFAGGTCREGGKFIETALGQPTGERRTGEFHETIPAQQDVRQAD